MNRALARHEHADCVQAALLADHLSAILCAQSLNVLVLTGFAPVTGAAVAVADMDVKTVLAVPEDAGALARAGWTDHTITFRPSTLSKMNIARAALHAALTFVALDHAEPGAYLQGCGGVSNCNMAAVNDNRHALLSPFQLERREWCTALCVVSDHYLAAQEAL